MIPPLDGLLLDVDGVLFQGSRPLCGAMETLRTLMDAGVPFRLLSNKTLQPHREILERFRLAGIDLPPEWLITPPLVAARWLRQQGDPPVALFLLPPVWEDFRGIQVLPPEAERGADYVIVGDMGDRWSYAELNRALRLLLDGAQLVALGLGRYWMAPDGPRLDTGAFAHLLMYATGQQARVIGKPDPRYFRDAVEDLGLSPERVGMVGDDILSDVGAAQAAGLRGILVQTGKFQSADLHREITPDWQIPDVRGVLQLVLPRAISLDNAPRFGE